MLVFNARYGQSIWNIVLNTYGSIDFLTKLLIDNKIENINYSVKPNDKFIWDETLVENQNVSLTNSNSKVIYATLPIANGSVLSVVLDDKNNFPPQNDYQIPNINPEDVIKYEQTISVDYSSAGGETSIILSELIGANSIVQIEREIKPLKKTDYSFNANSGQITLLNGIELGIEDLSIIYTKIVTS